MIVIFSIIFLCVYSVMCPKGDDPLTVDQNLYEFQVDVYKGTSAFNGHIGIKFERRTAFISVASPSSSNCINGLIASGSYKYVDCVYTETSSSHYTFVITVHAWPTLPIENNLFSHDGAPDETHFYCDVSRGTVATGGCRISVTQTTNVKGLSKCYIYLLSMY